MSQLIVLAGKVEKKGKLSKTENGNSYIRIVLLELGGNKENELPITFWGEKANKVNNTIEEGMMVQCEPELVSFENKKYDHTWYNLNLNGKSIKELKFDEYKKVDTKPKTTPSDVRKFAEKQIEKHDTTHDETQSQIASHDSNTSAPSDSIETRKDTQSAQADTLNEQKEKNTLESPNNTVSDTDSTPDEDFDASLFEDM